MPQRPLYFMAKPPRDVAGLIWSLPRTARRRPAELLHITILPLIDLADAPPRLLPALLDIMAGFEGAAFRVVFDRIVERRAVMLRGSEPIDGALAFQRRLKQFLIESGFPFFGQAHEPHLTISYHRDGQGDEATEPISWQVTELVLVESVYGETRHVAHGRWPLR